MEKEKDAFIVCLFLLVFVAANLAGWYDVTTPIYVQGVEENDSSVFVLPLLFWIGQPAYSLIGETAFLLIPLALLIISLFFILRTFDLFGLQKELIVLSFLSFSRWIPSLLFFNRDGLFFAEASAFTFFFALFVYKKDRSALLFQVLILLLMFYTKAVSIVFLFIILAEVFYLFRSWIDFLPALIPAPFQAHGIFYQHYSNIVGGLAFIPFIRVEGLLAFMANPVFGVSALTFAKKRNSLVHLLILSATVLCVGILIAQGHDIGRVLRYTLPLVPLNLFAFAMTIGEVRGVRWLKVISAFAIAKVLSGIFYMDAIWKLII